MSLKTDREKTLEFVNELCTIHGGKPIKTLPKGEPGDGELCPLGRAISQSLVKKGVHDVNVDVEISFAYKLNDSPALKKHEKLMKQRKLKSEWPPFSKVGIAFTPPKFVDRFITAFDEGKHPDLMEN